MKKLSVFNGNEIEYEIHESNGIFSVLLNGKKYDFENVEILSQKILLSISQTKKTAYNIKKGKKTYVDIDGNNFVISRPEKIFVKSKVGGDNGLLSPMPGKIIKVNVVVGQTVKKGDAVVVMEAMKMEHTLKAPKDGKIVSIAHQEGDLIDGGVPVVELGDPDDTK